MDDESNAARRRRAQGRAAWPGRKKSLEDSGQAPEVPKTAEERFAMVWQLTCDAWALSGRPFPTYSRAEMPGRVLRLNLGGPPASESDRA